MSDMKKMKPNVAKSVVTRGSKVVSKEGNKKKMLERFEEQQRSEAYDDSVY
jgi:hypothetical protein